MIWIDSKAMTRSKLWVLWSVAVMCCISVQSHFPMSESPWSHVQSNSNGTSKSVCCLAVISGFEELVSVEFLSTISMDACVWRVSSPSEGFWGHDNLDQTQQTGASAVHAHTDGARPTSSAVQRLPGAGKTLLLLWGIPEECHFFFSM